MEMDQSPQIVAKKIWSIIRIVLMMVKTGISKSKLVVDLNLIFKRGNKLANKAINTLLHQHQHLTSLSCHSANAHLSFISPKEYEFSCSNSPAFLPRRRYHYHHHGRSHHWSKSLKYNDVTTVSAVQRVLEMLNEDAAATTGNIVVEEPSTPLFLPGFGHTPLVRQLRVTDSPFPVKDEGDCQVDNAAEEFINKFYKNLRSQKRMAPFESPYRGAWVK